MARNSAAVAKISYDYPVMVNGRYLMSPSPIPAFDTPKHAHAWPALQLFGAGREKPPLRRAALHGGAQRWTSRTTPSDLTRAPHPLRPVRQPRTPTSTRSLTDDRGGRMFVCSDTDHCTGRVAMQHREAAE